MPKHPKRLAGVGAGALAGVLALAGVGGVLAASDGPQTLTSTVTPKNLPKNNWAPAALTAMETTAVNDDSPPNPRLVRAVAKIDRDLKVNVRGLPTCAKRKLLFTTPKQARNKCKAAIVGRGNANAKVNFPDQDPFFAPAPVTVFNAPPKGGKPVIMIHAYALRPAPTTFLVPGVLKKTGGKYGYKVTLKVPIIAGGSGTLIFFKMKLSRRFKVRGKSQSYGLARCKDGKHDVNVVFHYADGSSRDLTSTSRCT
jgi:hypothetical protein